MNTKLTLTLSKQVIEKAKNYSKNNKTSLSKLVEFYFKSLSEPESEMEDIPPITRELSGLAKLDTNKSDKELLIEALSKKYL